MKLLVAITLVIVSLVSAEPPNGRIISQRQTAAPYQPRGWRPDGPAFNPTTFQRQQAAPAQPSPSYGPPPSVSYGPPDAGITTTEEPITTTESISEGTTLDLQGEDIKSGLRRGGKKAEQLQNEPQTQTGPVYVVLPQGQSLIYAAGLRSEKSAALTQPSEPKREIEIVKEPRLAPIEAVPVLASIQAPVVLAKYQQTPQLVQFEQLQAVPYTRYVQQTVQNEVTEPKKDVEVVKEPKLAPVQAVPALARVQAPVVVARYEQVQLQQVPAVPYTKYVQQPVQNQLSEPKEEVEVAKEPKLAPVQAVPVPARVQAPVVVANYEQIPQLVQLQQVQAAPYARYVSTLSQTAVHTPYSDSFVQVYQ